jgi:hypothetical protein
MVPGAPAVAAAFNRREALDRFRRARARTRALFNLLDSAAYFHKPIALRNPIVFYEGHLPAFAVNTLIKKGLGRPGIDEHLETIFARGIDPEEEAAAVARGNPAWPDRDAVRAYADAADARIEEAIANADVARCATHKRSGRSSSTRRCTRRRSPTCGIASHTSGRLNRRSTSRFRHG